MPGECPPFAVKQALKSPSSFVVKANCPCVTPFFSYSTLPAGSSTYMAQPHKGPLKSPVQLHASEHAPRTEVCECPHRLLFRTFTSMGTRLAELSLWKAAKSPTTSTFRLISSMTHLVWGRETGKSALQRAPTRRAMIMLRRAMFAATN